MSDTIIPQPRATALKGDPSALERLARDGMLKRLSMMRDGEIHLVDPWGENRFGRPCQSFPTTVEFVVNSSRFYAMAAFEGSVGAGEAYIQGLWSCSDLVALFQMMVANRAVMESLETGIVATIGMPILRAIHGLRRNTRKGSRRNIEAHYDLGNDFYRLFLDETMSYSCAIFERENSTLLDASMAKIRRLCDKLQLSKDDHLLEIGTGWGAFAITAAREYGCRVTTTTISREQYALAVERVREAGLQDRIEILFKDYRDLTGTYDKLVNIEMVEAVGHQFYGDFMAKCASLLKPTGAMAMQAITIRDQFFERAKKDVDFIKKFIFPGSCIPSMSALNDAAVKSSDFVLLSLEDLTPHYARTLRAWREAFMSNVSGAKALGFDDHFIRMWEYYLAYCEGGFLERNVATVQMVFARPGCRMECSLPPLAQ
ncbi:MAG: cyclopropane-fatty-acyl-phospholipid synthase family protein [Candidatus Sumerlaeota bacterium]